MSEQRSRTYSLLNEIYCLYNILAKSTIGISRLLLFIQFICLLYAVKQRTGMLRHALQNGETWFERNVAWSNYEPVSVIHASRGTVLAGDRENCFNEILIIYRCVCNAYYRVRLFYEQFYRLNMLCLVLRLPVF